MADIDVTFTDDIPKIEREGFTRESKYRPLLDACTERPGKAARMSVDTQGQASSRASSIRDAAEKHPNTVNGEGLFIVATRSGDDENEFHVYTKYVESGTDEYTEEVEARQRKAEKDEAESDESDEGETKPKAKRKTKAKAKAKTA